MFGWFLQPKVRLTFWQKFHATRCAAHYPKRHATPFNKSQRGKARRAERKFKLQQAECAEMEFPYVPSMPLHNRKEHH